MSDLYANPKIRDRAESLARNEIFYCVSSLVSSIAQAPDTWRALGVDEDEVFSLCEMRDFEDPARDFVRDMSGAEMLDFLSQNGQDEFDETTPDAALRGAVERMIDDIGADSFCDDNSIEPHQIEVYEHWIVSDYLARKLEAYGHPIARDFLGLTVWGRPTTGQSIALDSVILEIARDAVES